MQKNKRRPGKWKLQIISREPSAGSRRATGCDPTFHIGSLDAANQGVITVNPNDPVALAVTRMLEYDFSQLPVMQNVRDPRGMVTWKSIGSKLAFGRRCDRVSEWCESASIVGADCTLFDAIPEIVEYGYVLVQQKDRTISGIVSASDRGLQFQTLTQPFLLLREIELHVRELIGDKLTKDDFVSLGDAAPSARAYRTAGRGPTDSQRRNAFRSGSNG